MQNWQLRTDDYTAQNRDRIIADTSAAGFELKLPPGARYGEEIEVLIDGSNALTINPNGAKVNGAVEPLEVVSDRAKLAIVYKDEARGWIVGTGSTAGGGTEPTPTPTPTPTPIPTPTPTAPSAAGVEYAVTQSSTAFNSSPATYATLTDGNRETGTNTDTGNSWIQATFPSVVKVTAVTVGAGYIYPGVGTVQNHINGAKLQHSTNGNQWIDDLDISGLADSGPDNFKTFTLASPVEAKYWRLFKASYLATTEFKFE